MNATSEAIEIRNLSFRYGQRVALDRLCLTVPRGKIFCLLGPNGSGKTTLFRVLSTLERPDHSADGQQAGVSVMGVDLLHYPQRVRQLLGVVFQSPSLDRKLTVVENLKFQAALYGLAGKPLADRISEVTEQLGLNDRLHEKIESLSGGLKRRVELAKGILHRPQLLLLDEPSTGLDPAARLDLWQVLESLRQQSGVTVVLTTHLLEEADKADCIAVLHQGQLVAYGPPDQLRGEVGSQILTVRSSAPDEIVRWLQSNSISAVVQNQWVRASGTQVATVVQGMIERFGGQMISMTLSQPTLEDVFIAKTGHRFFNETSKDRVE